MESEVQAIIKDWIEEDNKGIHNCPTCQSIDFVGFLEQDQTQFKINIDSKRQLDYYYIDVVMQDPIDIDKYLTIKCKNCGKVIYYDKFDY